MKYRLPFYLVALALVCHAPAQNVWEKRIAPGLLYRQEVRPDVPLVINAIRFSAGSPALKLAVCKSKDRVFDSTPDQGRETVTSMIRRENALAGMNGDFFQVPYTGDPLGTLVRSGELISTPIYPRAAFGWGGGAFQIAIPAWKGTLGINGADPVPFDGLNETVGADKIDVEAPICGVYSAAAPNATVYAKVSDGSFSPGGNLSLTVTSIAADITGGTIPGDEVVLVASGSRAPVLAGLKAGDKIVANLGVDGFDWSKIANVVGGGPVLVKDGAIAIDWKEESFRDSFANKRYPRSAAGITGSGDLWFVTVDGRQPHTYGATLAELADIMHHLGCVQAMNFDGGGSAELAIAAGPLNRPSDGSERPIAEAFVVEPAQALEPAPKADHTLSIQHPSHVNSGDSFNLSVVQAGRKVPNREVLWMSWGAGWVDQGGTLHGFDSGTVQVAAFVRGVRVETTVTVGTGKGEGGMTKGTSDN